MEEEGDTFFPALPSWVYLYVREEIAEGEDEDERGKMSQTIRWVLWSEQR